MHVVFRFARTDAWFHVDSFTSVVGSANSERVRSVRGKLLAIASLCNLFAIVAVHTKYDLLLTLYTFGKELTPFTAAGV